jgi:5'-3' exonuclease
VTDSARPILLIDAYNLFTRHFCANPTLNKNGQPIGGAVGFLRGLKKITDEVYPKKIYVIWEGGGSSRRRKIFPEYKQNRKPQRLNRFYSEIPDTIDNRNYQVALLISLLKNTPVCQVYVSDCEADDVIGYCAKYVFREDKCVIYSSDKDFYQLLSDKNTIYSPTSKKYIDVDDVVSRFHVHPENFCLVRSFCGDPSDGIPGIKGVGFKTMVKRFPEVTLPESLSVEEIITLSRQRSKETKVKAYTNIVQAASVGRRNWKLMYLDTINLSATQIQKIQSIVDTYQPSRNKITVMRELIKEGMHTFDVDGLFFSLNFAIQD